MCGVINGEGPEDRACWIEARVWPALESLHAVIPDHLTR